MIPELCASSPSRSLVGLPLALRLSPSPRDPSSRVGEGLLLGIGVCAATLALLPWSRWIVIRDPPHRRVAWTRPTPPSQPPRGRFDARSSAAPRLRPLRHARAAARVRLPHRTGVSRPRHFSRCAPSTGGFSRIRPTRSVHVRLSAAASADVRLHRRPSNGWNDAHLGIVHVAFAAALDPAVLRNRARGDALTDRRRVHRHRAHPARGDALDRPGGRSVHRLRHRVAAPDPPRQMSRSAHCSSASRHRRKTKA